MPDTVTYSLADFLVYQVLLAQAEVAEEAHGAEHETTQELFWSLMDYPLAAEA